MEGKQAAVYEEYSERILRYIRSRVHDLPIAEDLCSSVFLKICQKLDTFDEKKASLSTWVYAIARNTLTDYYRTRHPAEEIPETLAEEFSVEDTVVNEEQLALLADALEKLDERGRTILLLRYYDGQTLREIARRLNISYAYIKVLHNRALADVKKNL